jgi:hypothetical protein
VVPRVWKGRAVRGVDGVVFWGVRRFLHPSSHEAFCGAYAEASFGPGVTVGRCGTLDVKVRHRDVRILSACYLCDLCPRAFLDLENTGLLRGTERQMSHPQGRRLV